MSIEQKIADLLEESQELKDAELNEVDVDEEVELEESRVFDSKDSAESIAKKLRTKHKDGNYEVVSKKDKHEIVHPYLNRSELKSHISSVNEEIETQYDVSEDVAALVGGEDLTEDFKVKAATIFEAAIISRVKSEVAKLDEQFEVRLEEEVETIKEGLVEKVDGYLNFVVEQWMEKNELALESGIKSELTENFIRKLKTVFVESYIDVPEEKFDILGDMEVAIESLESKLNESVEIAVELTKELNQIKRASVITESAKGLADTDAEKFSALAEELSFEDSETFASKLQIIRESYFGTKQPRATVESVVTDAHVPLTEEKTYSAAMSGYLKHIERTKS
jgi:hypothetical protein